MDSDRVVFTEEQHEFSLRLAEDRFAGFGAYWVCVALLDTSAECLTDEGYKLVASWRTQFYSSERQIDDASHVYDKAVSLK